ncbi:MAG: CoB--CoM heterodisulfide reductase subunit B [Methanomassiliicoccales archaeon PtaU1.Bin124]|nr:MAG: CoB--CoM heterodisulfide reductase subunit B [Methanomassiliicoccales archaeon PtaU1.Bin124]
MNERFYLFRGCLIPTRLPQLESSARFALDKMGIDAPDLPGATCCVEPIGLQCLAEDTWLLTAARMLAIAESDGREILTLCNGCYLSFVEARNALNDSKKRGAVNQVLSQIGREYHGRGRVAHLLEVVGKHLDTISALRSRDLSNLKIAPHTGCHAVRPSHADLAERSFAPRMLANIASSLGADVVHLEDWPACCGGGIAAIDEKVSSGILEDVTSSYRNSGANCILTPCPFCFSQFDMRQREGIPVMHLSQLLAHAFGAGPEVLGWKYHRTKVTWQ